MPHALRRARARVRGAASGDAVARVGAAGAAAAAELRDFEQLLAGEDARFLWGPKCRKYSDTNKPPF